MKNLTDFHKPVETGADPRLQLKKARARESDNGARDAKNFSFFPSFACFATWKTDLEREIKNPDCFAVNYNFFAIILEMINNS